MEFVAKRRAMAVTIEDVKHEMKFPTMGDLHDHDAAVAKEPSKGTDHIMALIARCGLPIEAQMKMEATDIFELFEVLIGKKKL